MNRKILITGANGQVGTRLYAELAKNINCQITTSDITENKFSFPNYEKIDVTDFEKLITIAKKHEINEIFHMAAILSSNGEKNPNLAWDVNMNGFLNVLNLAKTLKIKKLFYPSSIAVFSSPYNKGVAFQNTISIPKTMYGINKLTGENLCKYYHLKYGLDIRSIRYPGIIGPENCAGGGTTDYAVEIFHDAIEKNFYNCFLSAPTTLPMIYIDDAIRATLEIMEVRSERIKIRTSYNLAGISFNPFELSQEIKKHIPDFRITYFKDPRQIIADSWPNFINDLEARNHWGWNPKFELSHMVEFIIDLIKSQNSPASQSA